MRRRGWRPRARAPYRADAWRPGFWLFLPTYNEVGNLEAIVARDDARSSSAPRPATGACSWWTTPRPTAPARSPTGSPRELRAGRGAAPAGQGGAGPGLPRRLRARTARRRRAGDRDGRRLLPRPGAPACADRRRRGQRPGARLAVRARAAGSSTGRRCDGCSAACGSVYARAILGVGVRDLTSGFRCVRREVLETIEPSTLRCAGLRVQHRADLPSAAGRASRDEVPICFRDREAGESKMSLPIAIEALVLRPEAAQSAAAGGGAAGWGRAATWAPASAALPALAAAGGRPPRLRRGGGGRRPNATARQAPGPSRPPGRPASERGRASRRAAGPRAAPPGPSRRAASTSRGNSSRKTAASKRRGVLDAGLRVHAERVEAGDRGGQLLRAARPTRQPVTPSTTFSSRPPAPRGDHRPARRPAPPRRRCRTPPRRSPPGRGSSTAGGRLRVAHAAGEAHVGTGQALAAGAGGAVARDHERQPQAVEGLDRHLDLLVRARARRGPGSSRPTGPGEKRRWPPADRRCVSRGRSSCRMRACVVRELVT